MSSVLQERDTFNPNYKSTCQPPNDKALHMRMTPLLVLAYPEHQMPKRPLLMRILDNVA
jgi:hypothetical protein